MREYRWRSTSVFFNVWHLEVRRHYSVDWQQIGEIRPTLFSGYQAWLGRYSVVVATAANVEDAKLALLIEAKSRYG